MRLALLLSTPLLLASGAMAAVPPADPDRIATHVAFLADDLLEGREAGTRGYDLAALYVSSQFAQAGLVPAGDKGGWLQAVPLLRGQREQEGSKFVIERPSGNVELRFEHDYLPGINFDSPQWDVSAPLVFVGHGVVAPEYQHDDFAGVDVRGKIAVVVRGAPARFEKDARAFYSSQLQKGKTLSERGAVGVIDFNDPELAKKLPPDAWAKNAANWRRASMRLRDAQGAPVDTFPQLRGSVSLSIEAARKLFEGAPQSADEVFRQLKAGKARAFDLPGQARMSGRSTVTKLASSNVVGVRPGSDPVLAREFVVYTAHLDGLGVGAEIEGDGIYNGALDNALGTAVMLETARLTAQLPPTARSQVFVAVTAEEKGLLGSEHFARNPSVAGRLVANLNIDMPVILSAQRDAIALGIEHSSLKADVEAAAAELGVDLSPDPNPEEVYFVRSDQFSFIRRGVPAVVVNGGMNSTTPGVDAGKQIETFRRLHYHQPGDEIGLGIHYPTAARLAALNLIMGQRIGNAAVAPSWNEGNFFGERFAKP